MIKASEQVMAEAETQKRCCYPNFCLSRDKGNCKTKIPLCKINAVEGDSGTKLKSRVMLYIGTIFACIIHERTYDEREVRMKKYLLLILSLIAVLMVSATGVSRTEAGDVAASFLQNRLSRSSSLHFHAEIASDNEILAYVYLLQPQGFIVVSAETDLPPVIAYSEEGSYKTDGDGGLLEDMIRTDLSLRLAAMTEESAGSARQRWAEISQEARDDFEQWPPAGYSFTGGWLKTNWTQSSPYNSFVPLDPVNGSRSVAGCPSVAMAMIVNYHETLNGTRLDDSDDYYHSYAGRNYWIDNDYEALDFVPFDQLNVYLDELDARYKYEEELTNADKAALVWACGVAARQVYTSGSSGTFSVNQAFQAFERFNFEEIELLTDANPDVYDRIAQNMMDAMPVHLAVVTPAWDAGHNVVVDGYNTDDYFHLNFGWGGQYNGWYLLPSGVPYNLTVLEGAIVDITPKAYLFVFPDDITISTVEELNLIEVEMINITSEPITIEDVVYDHQMNSIFWYASFYPQTLPFVLNPGLSAVMYLTPVIPLNLREEYVSKRFRVIHSHGSYDVNVHVEISITSVEDEYLPSPGILNAYPNPFTQQLHLELPSKNSGKIGIYNLKGQLVRDLQLDSMGKTTWDTLDNSGNRSAPGIYLIRAQGVKEVMTRKVLLY